MNDWFTIDKIDEETYIISEYRHWEETHCYLLNGTERSLLIDTGLGICNIYDEVIKLTDKSVTAAATHIHWDHIGGHKYFPDFYAHENELDWLSGGFPQPLETIKTYVTDRCELPAKRVFPAHHSLDIQPEIVIRMRDEFRKLKDFGKLHHGSGVFDHGDWGLWI